MKFDIDCGGDYISIRECVIEDNDVVRADFIMASIILKFLEKFENHENIPESVLKKMYFSFYEISHQYPSNKKLEFFSDQEKEYHAKIQEGCLLFGKHFQKFWTS